MLRSLAPKVTPAITIAVCIHLDRAGSAVLDWPNDRNRCGGCTLHDRGSRTPPGTGSSALVWVFPSGPRVVEMPRQRSTAQNRQCRLVSVAVDASGAGRFGWASLIVGYYALVKASHEKGLVISHRDALWPGRLSSVSFMSAINDPYSAGSRGGNTTSGWLSGWPSAPRSTSRAWRCVSLTTTCWSACSPQNESWRHRFGRCPADVTCPC